MDKFRDIQNDSEKIIGDRLRLLRERKKEDRMAEKELSRGEVAEGLYMGYKTYCRIENGERQLKADEIARLSSYYDISCDELLRGEKPEYYKVEHETGLSQKSIEYLAECRKQKPYYTEIMNLIFANTDVADMLYEMIYTYAATKLTEIKVDKSSVLAIFDNETDLNIHTIWSVVQEHIFSIFEVIRIEFQERKSDELDELTNKQLKDMWSKMHNPQKAKNIIDNFKEKVKIYEDSYNGRDFDESDLKF